MSEIRDDDVNPFLDMPADRLLDVVVYMAGVARRSTPMGLLAVREDLAEAAWHLASAAEFLENQPYVPLADAA